MADANIKRASLADVRKMKDRGEVVRRRDAPAGEDLGPEFWAKAHVEGPRKPKSVHLKLEPDVFAFFYEQANGKGHLTRMQNVLRAYVNAHRGA